MKKALTIAVCLMLLALAGNVLAQEAIDPRLMELCMAEGNPAACCTCGNQVLKETFNDQEYNAFIEAVELMDQMEAAYAANDQAKMEQIQVRMQELETILPETKFTELEAAVDAKCYMVCPD